MLSNEGSAEIYAESLSMAEISQADAKQYDRQIRLWGAQAQQRLSESRVLLIGLSSLGAEVAKNIVLAGIKSLCIFDPTLVAAKDSSNVFLFRPTDHGSRASDVFLCRILPPLMPFFRKTSVPCNGFKISILFVKFQCLKVTPWRL